MKNLFKLVGIIAFVAVIGFSMAACDEDPLYEDIEATTAGQLTITGLSAFEGEEIYVYIDAQAADVWIQNVGYTLVAVERATNQLVSTGETVAKDVYNGKVTNGQAVLKVFKQANGNANSGNSKKYESYTGNDSVQFMVVPQGQGGGSGTVHIQFSNGIGSGAFVPSP